VIQIEKEKHKHNKCYRKKKINKNSSPTTSNTRCGGEVVMCGIHTLANEIDERPCECEAAIYMGCGKADEDGGGVRWWRG
jgi:hypothetical protein